jgi:hypothetical protein
MVAAVAAGITWLTSGAIAGTAATIASSALLYAGTTAAAYFIEQANQPKQDIGTKLHATSGGAVNQSIIVGEKETAGSLIYSGSWGQPGKTPNGLYVRVFCLQDMPSSDYLARCWTSDNKGTLDKSHINYTDALDSDYPADGTGYSGSGQSIGHPITSLDHDGNHYGWVKILTGQQVAADPYLLAKFGLLADRPWTSSMIGRGRTLMIVTQRYTTRKPMRSRTSRPSSRAWRSTTGARIRPMAGRARIAGATPALTSTQPTLRHPLQHHAGHLSGRHMDLWRPELAGAALRQ